MGPPSPPPTQRPLQVVFKWLAAPDYVRDIINPYYGSQRMTFAFYSFFRSDRRAVLFKPLDKKREWVPFMCTATDEALKRPHDAIDIRMLRFIREQYCVMTSASSSSNDAPEIARPQRSIGRTPRSSRATVSPAGAVKETRRSGSLAASGRPASRRQAGKKKRRSVTRGRLIGGRPQGELAERLVVGAARPRRPACRRSPACP